MIKNIQKLYSIHICLISCSGSRSGTTLACFQHSSSFRSFRSFIWSPTVCGNSDPSTWRFYFIAKKFLCFRSALNRHDSTTVQILGHLRTLQLLNWKFQLKTDRSQPNMQLLSVPTILRSQFETEASEHVWDSRWNHSASAQNGTSSRDLIMSERTTLHVQTAKSNLTGSFGFHWPVL